LNLFFFQGLKPFFWGATFFFLRTRKKKKTQKHNIQLYKRKSERLEDGRYPEGTITIKQQQPPTKFCPLWRRKLLFYKKKEENYALDYRY